MWAECGTCASQVLDYNLSVVLCRTDSWVQLLAIAGERAQSTETQSVVCAVNAAFKPQRSFVHVEDDTDNVWRLEAWLHVTRVLVHSTVVKQTDVGRNVPTQRLLVGAQQRRVTCTSATLECYRKTSTYIYRKHFI